MHRLQELVHGAHDVGVRVERPASEADVGRPLVAEPSHQRGLPADDSNGQAPAQRLPVGDQVGPHTEILLGAAVGDAEPDEHLVEDQDDAALAAHLAKPPQPVAVRGTGEVRPAVAGDQRAVTGRCRIGVERLQRVHQDAGDVPACPEDLQRALVHVLEGVGVADAPRVANPRLDGVPPPVVGAAEAHQVRAPRCGTARAARPASRPRCRTCGTTLRRGRRLRAAAARSPR